MPRIRIINAERGTSYGLHASKLGLIGKSVPRKSWPALGTPAGHLEAGPLGEVPRIQEFAGSFYLFTDCGDAITARSFGTREGAEDALRRMAPLALAPEEAVARG